MRDLSQGLKGLGQDLATTQAAISIMERAIRQLESMADRLDGKPRDLLRQELISSIRERLAAARAKLSSIVWLMEEFGRERTRREIRADTSVSAEGTYGILVRAANCEAT